LGLVRKGEGREEEKESLPTYLDLVGDSIQEDIAPAALCPVRDERPPNAGIERDESAVVLPEVILSQDLSVRTEVKTPVGSLDNANVGVVGDQARGIRLAVQNKDEVGGVVDALRKEELQVLPGVGRLRVGVRDQRTILGTARGNSIAAVT
jgi:hypothetical protein